MSFIIAWLVTIGASYIMEASFTCKIFKDLAENGYRMDLKNVKKINNGLNPDNKKLKKIIHFIPFLNVMDQFVMLNNYNTKYDDLMYGLNSTGCLKEMTDYEKECYKRRPNGFNAMMISIKSTRENQAQDQMNRIIIHHKDEDSSFLFNLANGSINIYSSLGPLSTLSDKEKENLLLKLTLLTAGSDKNEEFRKEHGIKVGGDLDTTIIECNESVFDTENMKNINKVIEAINSIQDNPEQGPMVININTDENNSVSIKRKVLKKN